MCPDDKDMADVYWRGFRGGFLFAMVAIAAYLLFLEPAYGRDESLEIVLATETENGPQLTPAGCAEYRSLVAATGYYRDQGVHPQAFMEFFEHKQEKVKGMFSFLISEVVRVYASKEEADALAIRAGLQCAWKDGKTWEFYSEEMQ